MEKKEVILLLIIISVFFLNFVSAEVFFTQQPKDSYSFGDQIDVILGSDGSSGWTSINLNCGNVSSTKQVFFHYVTENDVSIPFSVPLTKDFLRDLKGDCYLSMVHNQIIKESLHFDISSKLDVNVDFSNTLFKPNEVVFFTGTVSKRNGDVRNGFAQITFPYNNVETIVPVSVGKFWGNISLQDNIPFGDYAIDIFVYEKDSNGEITNFHKSNTTISISQEPKTLNIDISDNIIPGSNLEFSARLFDQSGQTIDGLPVAFTLINSFGEQVLSSLSETGKVNSYKFKTNAPRGIWNMSAQSKGLSSDVKKIIVGNNVGADFSLINSTLIITNIGNVPYDKFVEVNIGNNFTQIITTNLSLGKSAEFKLEAPDGNYSIFVDDGSVNIDGIAALTGNTIGIRGTNLGSSFFSKYFFSWLIIAGIIGGFAFVSYRKVIKKKLLVNKNIGHAPQIGTKRDEKKIIKVDEKNIENLAKIHSKPHYDTADNSLVIKGEKQKASILSLKIKNKQKVDTKRSNYSEIIQDIIDEISNSNGKVYRSEDYIIGIFAPSITKTYHNALDVVKVADSIANNLKDYNKKYSQKISFGIGITEGDIIAKNQGEKLLFTPLGNSIKIAKKVSDIANNDYLLSEEINVTLSSKIKTIANPQSSDLKTYSINDVLDKVQHAQFINRFLERNDFKKLDDFTV